MAVQTPSCTGFGRMGNTLSSLARRPSPANHGHLFESFPPSIHPYPVRPFICRFEKALLRADLPLPYAPITSRGPDPRVDKGDLTSDYQDTPGHRT